LGLKGLVSLDEVVQLLLGIPNNFFSCLFEIAGFHCNHASRCLCQEIKVSTVSKSIKVLGRCLKAPAFAFQFLCFILLSCFPLKHTAFPSEVKDLTKKIHTVLQATAQMKVRYNNVVFTVSLRWFVRHSTHHSYY